MRLVRATQLFKAFADRTRLRILHLLNTRDLTGTQLADVLRVPRGRVTRHLAYLHKSGLISVRHEHNRAYYTIRAGDAPLHSTLVGKVIPLLRRVDGMPNDLRRCKKRVSRKA